MKIAVLGASGFVGSRVFSEALRRGHEVTVLASIPEKFTVRAGVTVTKIVLADVKGLAAAMAGHDAVVSAFNAKRGSPDYREALLRGYEAIIGAAKAAKARLIVVGGAGSLEASPGQLLMDAPGFPKEYKTEAAAMGEVLNRLRGEPELNWTSLSPAAILSPGERTGRYREGGDQLLLGADGKCRITVEDLAVALLDEVERPKHARQRFCVAY